MPPLVKQSISVFIISLIVTPVFVAAFIGIGSLLFSKSEDVTRIVAVMETAQHDFSSMAADIKELKLTVSDMSVSVMENHLIVLKTVMENDARYDSFRAKTNLRLQYLEEKVKKNENLLNRNYGFMKGKYSGK